MKRLVCLLSLLAVLLSAGGLLVFALPPGFAEPAGSIEMIRRAHPLAETKGPPPEPSSPEGTSPAETVSSQGSAPAPETGTSPPEEPPAPPPPRPQRVLPPVEGGDWTLRLVNRANPLPADFEPEYEAVQNRFVMDKRIAPVVRQMIADAQAEGVTLVVNSAYRPYYSQQLVYDNRYQKYLEEGKSEEEARVLTDSYVAVPGCSEHQLGLAMDIVASGDDKSDGGWLANNAPDYGFILRYPEDKTHITHTAYESWHYRYVGVPTAREITDRGLCLEEYLAG